MTKKLFPAIGLMTLVLLNCSNDPTGKERVQNNNYPVSMEGIDSLRLLMSVDDLEKLLKTKIALPFIDKGSYGDTVPVKYKGMEMVLYLEGDDRPGTSLRGIETSDAKCRTAPGIGTGSDKINVINAYPDNLKYVAPEYEVYPQRSSTRSAVAVMDTIGSTALVFHVVNKKVTSVEVKYFYEFY